MQRVRDALHAQEQQTKMRDSALSNAAFMAKQGDKKKAPHTHNHTKQDAECRHCGKTNHTADKCWRAHPDKAPPGVRAALKTGSTPPKAPGKRVNEAFMTSTGTVSASDTTIWYVDSGCSKHICRDRAAFVKFDSHNEHITIGKQGATVSACGVGVVRVYVEGGGTTDPIDLTEVFYVPECLRNLFSVGYACTKGANITFMGAICTIKGAHGNVVARAKMQSNNIYVLNTSLASAYAMTAEVKHSIDPVFALWHDRLAHIGVERMRLMQGMVIGMGKLKITHDNLQCVPCSRGKQKSKPIKSDGRALSKLHLELVHTDVCGPMSTPSIGGANYFALFVDDASRKVWVAFLQRKSDLLEKFKQVYHTLVNTKGKIITLRCDNGGEYTSTNFTNFCRGVGVVLSYTAPNTPQQNGVAERKIGAVVSMARCMLQRASLSSKFWAEAIAYAVHICNRIPTKLLRVTPDEHWYGEKPSVTHLRTFGCPAQVLIEQQHTKKMDSRSRECIYLGPAGDGAGNRFYNQATNAIFKSRNADFFETKMASKYFINQITNSPVEGTFFIYTGGYTSSDDEDEDHVEGAVQKRKDAPAPVGQPTTVQPLRFLASTLGDVGDARSHPSLPPSLAKQDVGVISSPASLQRPGIVSPALSPPSASPETTSTGDSDGEEDKPVLTEGVWRSGRVCTRLRQFWLNNKLVNNSTLIMKCMMTALLPEPTTLNAALQLSEAHHWTQAVAAEMKVLADNGTYQLVPLPAGRKAVSTKWVFKCKLDADGNVDRYKAHLVAKGFAQKHSLDYEETFAPVAKMNSIRIILAIAAANSHAVHQMDVNNAYLNGVIDVNIYMKQLPGHISSEHPKWVCKLPKGLYSLKQAGCIWYFVVHKHLLKRKFTQLYTDPCVFTRVTDRGRVTIRLYVDDFVIAGEMATITEIKQQLEEKFSVKDLGLAKHLVGLQVQQMAHGIMLTVSTYVQQMIELLSMQDANAVIVPLSGGDTKNLATDAKPCDATNYRGIIGKLMYVIVGTRPNIAYAVGMLGRHAANPTQHYLYIAKHVVHYLIGTQNAYLFFPYTNGEINIQGYVDSDWGSDLQSRKSTRGYVF